jgi:predicted RNA polymerase sigma factor
MAWSVQVGLRMLLRIDSQADGYYPYHVACAEQLRRIVQREAAAGACERALSLCSNSAECTYLRRRLDELRKDRS